MVESDAGPLYWEIDVLPLRHLQLRLDEESGLSLPGLSDDAVTLVQPVLGLSSNLEVRRWRVLRQVEAPLALCGA